MVLDSLPMFSSRNAEHELARPGLYVVATPIGNLEDITLRALRVLKQADLIACEDTRQTQKLLHYYEIKTPAVSYHEHNEAARATELLKRLQAGAAIALVSDAGTPAISDPGHRLIALAIQHRIPVIPVPGASAFVTALAAAALPTDALGFHGFLPPKSAARRRALEEIRGSERTEIFYEAPHRLRESLADIAQVLGADRKLVIARELTKVHEEFIRGTAAAVLTQLAQRQLKGEITLLLAKAEVSAANAAPQSVSPAERLRQIMREQKLEEKAALKVLARELGVSKSEAYRRAKLGNR